MNYFYRVLILLGTMLTGACTIIEPVAYVTPHLEKRGDIDLQAGIMAPSGLNVQAAISPVNNIGIGSSFSFLNNRIRFSDGEGNKINTYSIYGGYYQPLESVVLKFYGGYTDGRRIRSVVEGLGTDTSSSKVSDIRYNIFHFTPTIDLLNDEGVIVSTGFRLSHNVITNFRSTDSQRKNPAKFRSVEPFIGFRIGSKNLHFYTQAGFYVVNEGWRIRKNWFGNDDINFPVSLGLVYSFNPLDKQYGLKK